MFKKVVEDFVCENCGAAVRGGGFTNHCPSCLWSKDVDNDPGDRVSKCGGMMRPVAIENAGSVIVHRCEKCGKIRRNKSAPDDNPDAKLEIMRKRELPK